MEKSLAFTVPVERLAELVAAYLKPEIQKICLEMIRGPDKVDQLDLITRREACELLRISLPSLDKLSKPPVPRLKKYRVGRSVRYRKDEVLALLNQTNKKQHE